MEDVQFVRWPRPVRVELNVTLHEQEEQCRKKTYGQLARDLGMKILHVHIQSYELQAWLVSEYCIQA